MQCLILVGYRGAGKTWLGSRLASRLGWEFIDADAWLEQSTGKKIRNIFATEGEAAFRALESQCLEELLRRPESRILATGGGVVVSEANRRLLAPWRQNIVYLHASPADLAARLAADTASERPSLTGKGVIEEIAEVLAKRDHLYREVAGHILEVAGEDDPKLNALEQFARSVVM
jgi:shikimate kinase